MSAVDHTAEAELDIDRQIDAKREREAIAAARAVFNPKQAERVKSRVDRAVAKIEDDVAALKRVVPGAPIASTQISVDAMLEGFREIGEGLKATVDRLTR